MPHPTFKPVWIGSANDIRKQPHMMVERISKMIPAKDSWSPCFNEVLDRSWKTASKGYDKGIYDCGDWYNDPEFISGKVEVNLWPTYWGIAGPNNTFSVEKWGWRISIWGADDTMMAITVETKEAAQAIYDALDVCPTRASLLLWGFNYD